MPVTSAASGLSAGTIAYFAASAAPAGFVKANGAAVSRTTYAALFLAIGTTYGAGDGSTTFNVPDLRGEFLRSLDDGRGVDSGRGIGTAQADAMQGHYHDNAYSEKASNNLGGYIPLGMTASAETGGTGVRAPRSDGTNGAPRTASENRPRNVAMLACIKF